jgi:hypothetical protein
MYALWRSKSKISSLWKSAFQVNFMGVSHSATESDMPNNNLFCIHGDVIRVSRIVKMCNVFARINVTRGDGDGAKSSMQGMSSTAHKEYLLI